MTSFVSRQEALVREAPAHPAVEWGDRSLTRAELWSLVARFENQLVSVGLAPGARVALQLPRTPEWIAAALACWKLGCSWFPLSDAEPQERIQRCLDLALPSAHLTASGATKVAEQTSAIESEAYVIFTSGSTGQPKGVALGHDGLQAMLAAQVEVFGITEQSRVYWGLSTIFDASISDWGTALLAGATLCIRRTSESFSKGMREMKVTHADIPPALLPSLDPGSYPALSTVVVGGEVTDPDAVRRWAETKRIFNVYGPTETTVCASARLCNPGWSEPNIGAPLAGVAFRVNEASTDNQGELWIGGAQVALGYLGKDPALHERFVTHEGVRWFKTRDLVRKSDDGYIFLGRADRQRKVRGRLIAPEEVEAALLRIPAVRESYVDANAAGKLRAYVAGCSPAEDLRAALVHALPPWMIPSEIILVNVLPRTVRGKVDGAALPSSTEQTTPDNLVTQVLRNIAGHHVRADRSFRDNGLDSLDALKGSLELSRRGLYVSPETLMGSSRLTEENLASASAGRSLLELERSVAKLPLVEPAFPTEHSLTNEKRRSILLTGCTGSFGKQLLRQLVEGGWVVFCLIRPTRDTTSKERARSLLLELTISAANSMAQVRVLDGSLGQPQLGLSPSDYAEATQQVSAVLHCAADVTLSSTFEELRRCNVESLYDLSEFCRVSGATLHHVSSLGVFASQWPRPKSASETKLEGTSASLFGGYAQSKAAAEFYLYRQPTPWVVYRLGLLLNEDGSDTPPTLTQEARLNAPSSSEDIFFDVTPAGWCAKVLVQLLTRAKPGTVAHIAGREKLSASAIHSRPKGTLKLMPNYGESIPASLYVSGGIEFEVHARRDYEEWAGLQPDARATLSAHLDRSH
ncbi:MAG: acyl-coenzyme A synthetase/AMP-(fatty) acid ligase/nucleoside-diphosphate-sugar epimerase [Polyangiales bacterium]